MKESVIRSHVTKFLKQDKKMEAAQVIWPWMQFDSQTLKIWAALEGHSHLCQMGHGSAGKTFNTVAWYLLDWWTNPTETATVISSATLKSMRSRAWSDIKKLWSDTKIKMPGLLVDHRYTIKVLPLDDKHAFTAIAADSDDAITTIQGLHAKFVRIIIEEADNPFSNAIWSALANLSTSGHVRATAMANPDDKNSKFGQACQPVEGWSSINIDTDHEWKGGTGWQVLRLDGLKSPNIVAKKDIVPYLLTNAGVQTIREKFGEQSKEWMKFVRSWFPSDSSISTFFTAEIVRQMTQPIRFYGATQPVAACDPAFDGGDKCIVMLGSSGQLATDPSRTCVRVDSMHAIQRRDTKKDVTPDFATQIHELCLAHGVKPQNFAVEASGTSRSMSDMLRVMWSPEILSVNCSGKPTETRILSEDTLMAVERFDRFISEIWWVAREWCRLGLVYIPNMSREMQVQIEARRYDTATKKIRAETKTAMKERGLHSPDESDALTILLHLLRTRIAGGKQTAFPKASITRRNPKMSLRYSKPVMQPTYGE